MYSLNLNEVMSSAELPDKVFTNESRFELTLAVREHIMTNYPSAFPNPVTADRKIGEAIRDDAGLNNAQISQKKDEEFDTRYAAKIQKETEITNAIREKYIKVEDEFNKQNSEESAKLFEEMSEAETEEEKEQVQMKIDDCIYRYDEKMKELWNKRTAETDEALERLEV